MLSLFNTLVKASHVVNKVAKNEDKMKSDAEAAKVAANGSTLEIDADKKGVFHLPGCDEDIVYYADISAGADAPWVILLHDDKIMEQKAAKSKKKSKKKGTEGKDGNKDASLESLFPSKKYCNEIGNALVGAGYKWLAPCLPGFSGSSGSPTSFRVG